MTSFALVLGKAIIGSDMQMRLDKRLLLVLALATLGEISRASGQALPVVAAVNVEVEVSVSSGDILMYSYKLTNPSQNTGSLWLIALDISRASNTVMLSRDGLSSDDRLTASTSQLVLDSIGKELVPVGVQTPPNWNSSLTLSHTVEWGAPDAAPLIVPGTNLGGFGLMSRGLPGFRMITAEAYVALEMLPITEPSDSSDLPRYKSELAALRSQLRVSTTTIGPTALPADFKPADFLATIISYKEQAIQRGWIKDLGIAISLDAKLSAAQQSLRLGDNTKAKNQLNAFLNEVDAQAGKQITSEAVALLKFNAQFLISKLP